MTTKPWRGILTATALPFDASGAVDFGRYAEHVTWLIRNGSDGVVCNGSLG
ncbi:MAG: dihydrodipicolinate synthase family protein, partial [Actinomycetota bacterium]